MFPRSDAEPRTPRDTQALALIVVATLLMLSQHWGMMLSNSDDPWIIRSTLEEIQRTASEQGRFWLIPINLMAGLPYKLGGWVLGSATKILINGLALLAFAAFLARLVHLRFALITVLAWLALSDVSNGYYSAFHGFLMMFNVQMAALFFSLWWYLGLIDRQRGGWSLLGPYLLFGFSLLAYEPMLFFAGLYFAVSVFRATDSAHLEWTRAALIPQTVTAVKWALRWARSNWLLGAVVLAYLTAYFAYRYVQPTSGRGIDHGGEITEIMKTIFRFSIYGFRLEFNPIAHYAADSTPIDATVCSVAFAACLAGATYLLLPAADQAPAEVRLRASLALLVIAFFLFCPNILHGFVEGYRRWAAESPYYVGNYLSSFALAVLVAIGMIALVGGYRSRQEPMLLALVVLALGASAMDNMLKWSALAHANRRDSGLWLAAMADLKTKNWETPHATWNLCGKDSPEKVSGDDRFWSYELSKELGVTVVYRSKRLNSANCDLTVDFNRYRSAARP